MSLEAAVIEGLKSTTEARKFRLPGMYLHQAGSNRNLIYVNRASAIGNLGYGAGIKLGLLISAQPLHRSFFKQKTNLHPDVRALESLEMP